MALVKSSIPEPVKAVESKNVVNPEPPKPAVTPPAAIGPDWDLLLTQLIKEKTVAGLDPEMALECAQRQIAWDKEHYKPAKA